MVKFPDGFVQLVYPGYFWHPESERVFSLKSGLLKPLALNKVRWQRTYRCYGHLVKEQNFALSVNGRPVHLAKKLLKTGEFVAEEQEIQLWHSK